MDEKEGAQLVLLIIQGAITQLSEENQVKVKELAVKIRELIATDIMGPVALALVGAEYSAKEN